jgi:elongation factor P
VRGRPTARPRSIATQEPVPRLISTGELRKGVTIELDNELWQILDYHHIKMGRGSAQVRITLRNVKRGQTIERSFQAGTKWPRAQLEQRPVQFLYRDGDEFHFMDSTNYDQFVLRSDQLGDATRYLKDGMTLDRTSYEGETIGVELPVSVEMAVVDTEPGFAGDTQTGARKPATTETGLVVQVPIFVETGDTIRIDTRTGEYQTRV